MIGTIFKYAAVMAVGAVGFTYAGQYMDGEMLDGVKRMIEAQENAHADLTPEERKEKIQNFIRTNRGEWEKAITFASNVRELNTILNAWF